MAARLQVLDAGTWREITRLHVRQAGVWRRLKTLKVLDGATWRTVGIFADPLSLTVSPSAVSGDDSTALPVSITTGPAGAIPAGGTAPFTYAWTQDSGDAATINSPTSASTTFRRVVAPGNVDSGVFRCTATDSLGNTASDTVTATFQNFGA